MPSARKIAVAGATGTVGQHAAGVLAERGHQVVPMSRSQGVDVITGDGLAAALAGVDCVIDAATGSSPGQQAATAFFTMASRNLHEAGQRAGVRRMIVVSIIGTDRFTAGYGAAKIAHEQGPPVRAHPGACAARRAVPRIRRPARGVGHPRRGGLRAEDAHPARRSQGRRQVLANLATAPENRRVRRRRGRPAAGGCGGARRGGQDRLGGPQPPLAAAAPRPSPPAGAGALPLSLPGTQ